MTDAARRTLERAARRSDDDEARARALVARLRAGTLAPGALRLAAFLGHEPARSALGPEAPVAPATPLAWARALRAFGQPAWVRALLATLEPAVERWPSSAARGWAEATLAPARAWADGRPLGPTPPRPGFDPAWGAPDYPTWTSVGFAVARTVQETARTWPEAPWVTVAARVPRSVADGLLAELATLGGVGALATDGEATVELRLEEAGPASARVAVAVGRATGQDPLALRDLVRAANTVTFALEAWTLARLEPRALVARALVPWALA